MSAACLRYRGLKRLAPSAVKPTAESPRRSGERLVGDGGEPRLVRPERQQQVRDPVARRELAVVGTHAQAVDALSTRPDEECPRLAEHPNTEGAPLEHESRPGEEASRRVTDQIPEEADRHLLGP